MVSHTWCWYKFSHLWHNKCTCTCRGDFRSGNMWSEGVMVNLLLGQDTAQLAGVHIDPRHSSQLVRVDLRTLDLPLLARNDPIWCYRSLKYVICWWLWFGFKDVNFAKSHNVRLILLLPLQHALTVLACGWPDVISVAVESTKTECLRCEMFCDRSSSLTAHSKPLTL